VSSEVLQYTLTPGQTAVAGRGRIFNLLAAPGGPISVTADTRSQAGGQSPQRIFTNIPPGSKFTAKAGEEWTYLRITSAVAQVITIFIGDEDMSFNNAVTITGTAVVSVNPSVSITPTVAPTVVATGAAATVAGNPARRRITICPLIANTGVLYAQSVGSGIAQGGIPLQPGTFVEFDTISAIDVRNDTGANQSFSVFEES
jgi:hypothetical protein